MERRARPATGSAIAGDACPAHGIAGEFRPYDIGNPFPFYAKARREQPVFFSDELGYWVVTRHEDMLAIFKDPATFSSENTQAPYKPRPPEVTKVFQDAGITHSSSGLSARQPPDHTRLRGFIKKAFTPRRIATLEPVIRELAVNMIESMAPKGEGDLVADLTYELPALVIFRLVGVPDEDVPRVKDWAVSRVYLNFGDLPVDEQVKHAQNLVNYWRYCIDLVHSRFDEPQDDLTGALAQIYQDGDKSLSIDEIAGLVHTQLFAGHETTSSLLGDGLKQLLEQRDRWDDICRDPSLIPNAVEEIIRTVTPVFAWKRKLRADARVGDVDLPEGANLLMLLGSANRDDTVFPAPDAIDLHRENGNRHLAFGHGIHFCLGAPLARLEGKVVLEELTRRLPTLRLVPGQHFEYPANTSFRGPSHVLARWDAAAPALALPFLECGAADVDAVGGKAASLGEMTRAGLPVPDGFAVTTHAYSLALLEADIDIAAEDVRERIESMPLPADVADAITRAYADLGDDVPVAVRSSATAEDSADASFAGQQETYLWVVGTTAVLDAVKRCWASLFSDRAVTYREHAGIGDMLMGVAIQRMVNAGSAGVAMTLDPVNGDRSVIAIESSFGLGEAVVGGIVTPDSFRVDKVMLEVTRTEVAYKTVEIVPGGDSVIEREIDGDRRSRASLEATQVREVAALAKQAEAHYGCPQDIEWATEDGRVVLLQSRPETVWSHRRPDTSRSYMTGLAGIVQTLNNPLAGRRSDG